MGDVLRIGNCSGFYGDRLSAAREMVEGGPIDVLTGDYLAELTLMILHKDRRNDPRLGFAKTFPAQLRQVAATCLERGIRIVVNAGGLNPAGCADACRDVYAQLGLEARVAHLEGDDLLPRLDELRIVAMPFEPPAGGAETESPNPLDSGTQILTANAYLGAWGIAAALEHGADLVICPRVTDAALVVGPAAWRFGWARDDWHRLAGATVAGHILECGAQATGGNYAFFRRVEGLERTGFPLAEIAEDGSCVITKHPGTGGEVSIGTVTAQLLYEIGGPRYASPDVIARFDTARLEQVGPDRVRVHGVRGGPPPPTTKVCLNYQGGYRNSVTFLLGGLDLEAKAKLAERTLWASLGGRESFAESRVTLQKAEPEATGLDASFSSLTVSVKDPDGKKVGRRFSSAAVELALASYPGFNLAAPPGKERPFGIYRPLLVPTAAIEQRLVLADRSHRIDNTPGTEPEPDPPEDGGPESGGLPTPIENPTRLAPLGHIAGARSGDKGGDANLGVWVASDEAYRWLRAYLTVERLRQLLPEARELTVHRYPFPNLRALNFVLHGFLGDGVAASLAIDAQAKGLGEYLRAKVVPVPESLLGPERPSLAASLRGVLAESDLDEGG
ncbi:MAG: DUF1446 domain-containing protein [Holophagales bacterium]|nr:DUF1446 domain-containing protein [Holophagales bacterium]